MELHKTLKGLSKVARDSAVGLITAVDDNGEIQLPASDKSIVDRLVDWIALTQGVDQFDKRILRRTYAQLITNGYLVVQNNTVSIVDFVETQAHPKNQEPNLSRTSAELEQ